MAVKVLICDDDVSEIEKLVQLMSAYKEKNGILFDITSCSLPGEITRELQNSRQFDILFLDIYIEQLNGLDLAKLIRKNNNNSKIVFISTSDTHALEAFGVNASQYLVKPISYSRLAQTLDLLLKETLEGGFINVSCNNQIVKIFLNDLVYTETQRHYQALVLSNGTVERARLTRAELCEMLGGQKRFVRIGASFLVNLDYVVRVASDEVELKGYHVIHVPRRVLADLKQQYFDYYFDMEAAES